MTRWIALFASSWMTISVAAQAENAPPATCVLRVDLDGVVHRAAADFLERGMQSVEEGPCSALLVVIDTPGGALEATRSIATTFLAADAPVITYVHPGGARAGSAGVFVTTAGHIAAMSPGTNIGAAHPVLLTGQDTEEGGGQHLARKVERDTAAFARAIAEERGRNKQWMERAVLESASATAREALELGVVDRVASTVSDLLSAVDGQSVIVRGRTVTLETRAAAVIPLEPTLREQVLSVLGRPNVAYLLLMAGLFGLMLELMNPGTLIFGGAGAFCLVLAVIGLDMLPVHVGALALLFAGVAMLAAELFVASYGVLTLAGAATLLLGSALLIDRSAPEFFADASVRVSWGVVVPLVAALAVGVTLLAFRLARTRGQRARTGRSGLEGELGESITALDRDHRGWVRVHGERWQAVASEPVAEHTPVRVIGMRGLLLEVTPQPGALLS